MLFLFHLAELLHKSVAEVKQLSSAEITGWLAYGQIMDWVRKSDAPSPEKALEFARAVHGIFWDRYFGKGSG